MSSRPRSATSATCMSSRPRSTSSTARATTTSTNIIPNSSTCSPKRKVRRRHRRRPSSERATRNATREWKKNRTIKWQRRYFIDADASIPLPNDDTIRCSQWVKESSLSNYLSSRPQMQIRDVLVHETVSKNTDQSTGPVPVGQHDTVTAAAGASAEAGSTEATEEAYKVSHRKGPENAALQPMLVQYLGHPERSTALSLSGSMLSGGERAGGTSLDYFRCIQKERASSSINPALPSQPWRSEEDVILLKTVAAIGPQFVVGRDNAMDLTSRLLCDRSVKQTKTRANTSLVNPNFSSDKPWSDEEERKLVLLFRAYGSCESPLLKVFAHFPDRASKSVAEKWARSLAPKGK
mmetsp:Transcript_32118/g.71109  ORF Transcript_32118/g.71109 Transcript_32118/m.71109 type:complete len:351 (-) Transcript_32118:25-1077(-)